MKITVGKLRHTIQSIMSEARDRDDARVVKPDGTLNWFGGVTIEHCTGEEFKPGTSVVIEAGEMSSSGGKALFYRVKSTTRPIKRGMYSLVINKPVSEARSRKVGGGPRAEANALAEKLGVQYTVGRVQKESNLSAGEYKFSVRAAVKDVVDAMVEARWDEAEQRGSVADPATGREALSATVRMHSRPGGTIATVAANGPNVSIITVGPSESPWKARKIPYD